jgi:hypothetical protein
MAQAQQDLVQAIGERNALVAEKDEVVRQVVALDNQVQALHQELQEARHQSTPIGEGALLQIQQCLGQNCSIKTWSKCDEEKSFSA